MKTRVAVCVGVSDYPDPRDRLGFCAADAEAVAAALSRDEFQFDAIPLLDEAATMENIEGLFRLAYDDSENLETLLIFFAGHGVSTTFDTYLVTHDWRPMREGVPLSSLAHYADRFSARGVNIVILLDCCHSGAAVPTTLEATPINASALEGAFPGKASARIVIAGCRASEEALETTDLRHGVFTAALLRALAGEAADYEGNVTLPEVFRSIAGGLRERQQVPVMRGSITGEFILGLGFPPRRGAPVPPETVAELQDKGQQMISAMDVSEGSIAEWKGRRFRETAQECEGILRWFDDKVAKYPELANNPVFQHGFSELEQLRRKFSNVYVDTVLPKGRYVTAELGSGHFGTVYKVEDAPLGATLAYKVLHGVNLTTEDMRRRFSGGYEAMQRLDHPRVIKVYDWTEFPVGFYMQFLDAPNFRNVASEITGDPVMLIKFLRSIAETVVHAHERKVLHRDLKPENILANYNASDSVWEAYLTDFDLAWFSTRSMSTKEAYGAIHYAAPEQLMRPGSNDAHLPTVDIYSFGKLCFFGCVGRDPEPLSGDSEFETKTLNVALSEWPASRAATEMAKLYRHCVTRQPAGRLTSFSEVVDGLSKVLFSLRELEGGVLSPIRALEEVTFAISGLNHPPSLSSQSVEFTSLSGQTQLSIDIASTAEARPTSVDIKIHVLPLQMPTFEGLSAQQARVAFTRRVDGAIGRVPVDAKRQGTINFDYSFDILVTGVRLGLEGMSALQQALSRLIEVSEAL